MKRCTSCNQYFDDAVMICPLDRSALEPVRDNAPAGNAHAPVHELPAAKKNEKSGKQPQTSSKAPVQFDLDTRPRQVHSLRV
jgi:hypothetical protein